MPDMVFLLDREASTPPVAGIIGQAEAEDNLATLDITVYYLATIMDKLTSLRAFIKVVELGSFSEAGRQLRLSRSAISKYVSDLEQDLGVQLLNRTTRHASANENGQAYFERVLGILAELDAADHAVAQLQATPRGLLRVNAPMSFGTLRLGPMLADFMAVYPELKIHLVFRDGEGGPVQGRYDVTLRIADLESSSLIARRIVAIDRV